MGVISLPHLILCIKLNQWIIFLLDFPFMQTLNAAFVQTMTETRFCQTNTKQKRGKWEHFPQNTCIKPLSDRHDDSPSCANIHRPLTQSRPPFRRAAQLRLPTHISHGRQTQRRRHAENYRWKHTRAAHVMAASGSLACCLHSWTEKVDIQDCCHVDCN